MFVWRDTSSGTPWIGMHAQVISCVRGRERTLSGSKGNQTVFFFSSSFIHCQAFPFAGRWVQSPCFFWKGGSSTSEMYGVREHGFPKPGGSLKPVEMSFLDSEFYYWEVSRACWRLSIGWWQALEHRERSVCEGFSTGNSEAWSDGTTGGCRSNKSAPPWSFHLCLAAMISS